MNKLAIFLALTFASVSAAQAINLATLINVCGADAKAFCKSVGYGMPMQKCLGANKSKLKAPCAAIVARLEKGEKVRIFGN